MTKSIAKICLWQHIVLLNYCGVCKACKACHFYDSCFQVYLKIAIVNLTELFAVFEASISTAMQIIWQPAN